MMDELRRTIVFHDRILLAYPFPNPATINYYSSGDLLCSYEINVFLYHDLSVVLDYAKEEEADRDETDLLLGWYLTGHSIWDNPDGYTQEDGGPMDFISSLRENAEEFLDDAEEEFLDNYFVDLP